MVTLPVALGFSLGVIMGLVMPALQRVLHVRRANPGAYWHRRRRGLLYIEAKVEPEPEPIDSARLVRAFAKGRK